MIRTRFAPSPTGYLHIGGARTALFNWLYARNTGGKFVLRIEDTDTLRSTDESVKAILDGMKWLGLDWDEGPIFQTDRMARYKECAELLLKKGLAYKCYCSPEQLQARRDQAVKEGRKPVYDRRCREVQHHPENSSYVIRFKTPTDGETLVDDKIKGKVVFRNEELDDLVIVRSDGVPTYNFAVVIDDADMNITHIIRGDDHLNNTPRQINIYKALGFELPVFAHVPMILGSDKARLSKRHGATSVMAYKDMGYVSGALVNYLVRLGWSCGDQEIFSTNEMIEKFNIENIGKSAAVFNPEKLLWLNAHYIKNMDTENLSDTTKEFFVAKGLDVSDKPKYLSVLNSLKQRSRTVTEMAESAEFYYRNDFSYDEEGVKKFFYSDASEVLTEFSASIKTGCCDTEKSFEEAIRKMAVDLNKKVGQLAQILRLALTGKTVSPSLYDIVSILGKGELIFRLERANDYVKKNT